MTQNCNPTRTYQLLSLSLLKSQRVETDSGKEPTKPSRLAQDRLQRSCEPLLLVQGGFCSGLEYSERHEQEADADSGRCTGEHVLEKRKFGSGAGNVGLSIVELHQSLPQVSEGVIVERYAGNISVGQDKRYAAEGW